ncbi:MAG: tyrosine-type recombinase/integrase [Streptosporangiales bacterium]|nr:tyrosine-type recombinase/integrase [Streptosporangiales bacterium]
MSDLQFCGYEITVSRAHADDRAYDLTMASISGLPEDSVRHAQVWPALRSLIPSWELALEAADKSRQTIRSYTDSGRALVSWLAANQLPVDVCGVKAEHVRGFLAAESERTSPASADVHFRNLRVFWNWLVAEGEHPGPSPMKYVERPIVPKTQRMPLEDAELTALLRTCQGNTFEDRRDLAMMRILIDNGMRISSLAGLRYDSEDDEETDVFLKRRMLRIRKKSGDHYFVPIGKKSAAAIDRYLRARSAHPRADSPYLWLGSRGHRTSQMTTSGIRQMIERRAEQAGVQGVHPHRFRRTFADEFLGSGGNLDDLMVIGGWSDYNSVKPYLDGRKAERARIAHERLSPGDRL